MRKKGMFVSVMIVVVGLLLFGLGSATNDVKADIIEDHQASKSHREVSSLKEHFRL